MFDRDKFPLPFMKKGHIETRAMLDAIRDIQLNGDYDDVVMLTGLCLDMVEEIRSEAWRAIQHLFQKLPLDQLPKLDTQMRAYQISVGLRELEQWRKEPIPTVILGLISFNRSGRVREEAVSQLASRFDGAELPFLILRANDWVGSVQRLAEDALKQRLVAEYGEGFTTCVPILKWLWNTQRREHSTFRMLVEELLCAPKNQFKLVDLLKTSNKDVGRYISEILVMRGTDSDKEAAIVACSASPDVLVRYRGAQAAFGGLSEGRIWHLVPIYISDRFGPIRREALRWATEHRWNNDHSFAGYPSWSELLPKALFDRNSGVREFAMFKQPEIDFGSLYLAEVENEGEHLDVALRALFQLKREVPNQLIERYLTHKSGKIRSRAYSLAFNNSRIDKAKLFRSAIVDDFRTVRQEGKKYLTRNRHDFSGTELWELLNSTPELRMRRTILEAIARLSKWESLPYLLEARVVFEGELFASADKALERWIYNFNSTSLQPSAAQKELCLRSFEKFGDTLFPEQRTHIGFVCQTVE